MTGIDRFSDKERRKMRRKNHIARDLRTPKYRQRRVEKDTDEQKNWTAKDWLKHLDEE